MSEPDKEKIAEQTACPFCSSTGDCEHLLLLLDLTFRTAEGGDLLSAFRARWSKISDRAESDFDEQKYMAYSHEFPGPPSNTYSSDASAKESTSSN